MLVTQQRIESASLMNQQSAVAELSSLEIERASSIHSHFVGLQRRPR
jgi:hypothetical protein